MVLPIHNMQCETDHFSPQCARQLRPWPKERVIRFAGALSFAVGAAAQVAKAEVDTNSTSIFSPASAPAHLIVNLAHFVLLVTGGIFVVVLSLIIYAAIRFRHRPGEDESLEPAQVYGSDSIELAWTIVPLVIATILALTTARVIQQIQNPLRPAAAVDVQVVGHQFWWEVRYPKYGIVTANEIHVPVSDQASREPTFIDLRSADVVHSFWVPRLAGKLDLVPGHPNSLWIEPEKPGLYLGQCAEYCGTAHSLMLLRVYADTPAEFARWVANQKAEPVDDPSVAAGRRVFESYACINCHGIAGTSGDGHFGPDLTHLMSRDTLGAGAAANTADNLKAWIKDPGHLKPGVLMPAMNLSDDEIDALATYLATLK
jgi:cytochrome c oxidase subunit 2